MNILMVATEQIPVPGSGSVEICMLAIAKQLAKSHKVTILSRQSPGLPVQSQHGNVSIVRVAAGSSQTYLASVLHYVKDKKFDLIQVDNRPHYMASIKKLLPHIPVSLFLHSLTFIPATKTVSASIAKADIIIVNSESLKSRVSQRFPQQAHKLKRVYLGADITQFSPSSGQGRRKIFHVLFVGRLIPRKGVSTIMKAMQIVNQQIPNAKLIVVGRGKAEYVKQLKALAQQCSVVVEFRGGVDHQKINTIYQDADCFVCPSQEHEAFGLVNVEAMASGLPIVASNIGGIKEIVKHGINGYLVKSYKTPEEHAKWIIHIANNKKLAAKLAKQAMNDAKKRFSWQQTASNLMKIYKGLHGLI